MDAALRELTAGEIAAYDEHGVVVARGLFPDHWLARMAAAVDHAIENPTPYGAGVSMEGELFTGDLFLWKTYDEFRDWIYQSPAALIAAQVLRAKTVRHFYDQLFIKPAGCHVATPWHQDITFWPVDVESRQLCSIWITFDPVARETSGLEFVRGSHRWPQHYKAVTPNYDSYMLDSNFDDPPDIEANRDQYDLYCPDMQAGDCLIFDPHVLHGSTGNYSTDAPRRAFSTRWAGDGVHMDLRHATMPLLWTHGLASGDLLSGPLFPQVLPRPIEEEGAAREGGPEAPDTSLVEEFMERLASVPLNG